MKREREQEGERERGGGGREERDQDWKFPSLPLIIRLSPAAGEGTNRSS